MNETSYDRMLVTAHPNPSDGRVTFSWAESNSSDVVYIYSLTSDLLLEKKSGFENKMVFNLDLTTGTYIYQIISADGKAGNGKLIIKDY